MTPPPTADQLAGKRERKTWALSPVMWWHHFWCSQEVMLLHGQPIFTIGFCPNTRMLPEISLVNDITSCECGSDVSMLPGLSFLIIPPPSCQEGPDSYIEFTHWVSFWIYFPMTEWVFPSSLSLQSIDLHKMLLLGKGSAVGREN